MNGALSRSSKRRVVARLHLVAEDRRIPFQLAEMAPCVGVEQQLVRIEAVALVRLVGSMHAIAVDCSRRDPGQIAMPDLIGVFRQVDADGLTLALLVEQADLDSVRMRREQREIDPFAVPCRAERMRQPFPNPDIVQLCYSFFAKPPGSGGIVSNRGASAITSMRQRNELRPRDNRERSAYLPEAHRRLA